MYSQDAILALTGRVGWKQYPASFPFTLSTENQRSDSGMYFQDFSSFVTLTNIKDTMDDAETDEASFNEFLTGLQTAAIASVLSALFRESHETAKYRNVNFDDVVQQNISLFDEAIGLQTAASVVEMMYSSVRSNSVERQTKDMSALLFRELNGLHTDNGVPVSTGLKNNISREIVMLKKCLFPKMKPFIATPCFT